MNVEASNLAYIHGDVAADGTIPSGDDEPFDQMLLNDTGSKGLSIFADMMEAEDYKISPFYDQEITLDEAFLSQFDAIIFGLHQKIWSDSEKAALDAWLQAGGGMLIYSDSASGGLFREVGIKNPVGQNAVNNLTAAYGLQVTVDQGGGTRAYSADAEASHPIVEGPLVMEGEGVSVVAVDPTSGAQILIPFNDANRVSGGSLNIDAGGVTIANPVWATLAVQNVGDGHVLVMFDRQAMWNSGPGSDISKRDNMEILRRIVKFMVGDLETPALAHNVYFTLHDPSESARAKLIADCRKYLSSEPGIVTFAAGEPVASHDREVNVRDWDVGLHIVFKTKHHHDRYQTAPDHQKFIDENQENWKSVRVFDTFVR